MTSHDLLLLPRLPSDDRVCGGEGWGWGGCHKMLGGEREGGREEVGGQGGGCVQKKEKKRIG